ncbi:class IV aminotransferase [Candidatus Roizmanbacteria bacterium CG11_big_fil_rev_8_21_14_0_20_37_16]|uniref:Class IV aminotransferase n=1 Tax=Candidatus Roizmanbacteria bacterium CG11_big_fil_rev_8_21_14_0_20_37_16 TaxID=1974857 RepID=A0A2H0KJG3_9BACT|nr:MAG: class IV aminotransferase [Candidatus Roizmanbacteria bacterium CG11_big_fil_rev_8_21_14_0_20_37_16]
MDFKHFSQNGKILPIEQAVIPLNNIEYSYGFGVYESLRVINGTVYFIKDHIERLIESAKIINLTHSFDEEFIEKSITDLIHDHKSKTFNLKILLIGGATKEKAILNILCLNPLFPDRKLYRDGAEFITYNYERAFPHAKTLNMLESYLAYRKAKESGAYDALLINRGGFITEGTRTNFFCIKDRTIYTPNESDILLGVMRKAVLKVAFENNYKIIEKNISLDDIKSYDGAFVTSTSSKIMPIKSIDETILNVPDLLKELMKLLSDFLESCQGKID